MYHFILYLCLVTIFINTCKADSTTAYTQQKCYTRVGSSSIKSVPTVSKFVTLSFTFPAKTIVTPTSTVTPASIVLSSTTTITSTIFSSTQTARTATIAITSTASETTSTVTTSTTTSTSITTSTLSSTTTIPTPSGFVPISQLDTYRPRGLLSARSESSLRERKGDKKHINARKVPTLFAQRVTCIGAVEVVIVRTRTYTASPRTITAMAPTSTFTTTQTSSVTSISTLADTTTTVTDLSATTITSTTTSTIIITEMTTSTSTVPGPVSTEYAACQTNNIIYTANGNQVLYIVNQNNPIYTRAGSAIECCNACQQLSSSFCTSFAFMGTYEGGCRLGTSDTCPASQSNQPSFSTKARIASAYNIGNGPCGQYKNNGSQN